MHKLFGTFVDWCSLWYNSGSEIGKQQVEEYILDNNPDNADEVRSDLNAFIDRADELKAMKDATKRTLGADDIRWE